MTTRIGRIWMRDVIRVGMTSFRLELSLFPKIISPIFKAAPIPTSPVTTFLPILHIFFPFPLIWRITQIIEITIVKKKTKSKIVKFKSNIVKLKFNKFCFILFKN